MQHTSATSPLCDNAEVTLICPRYRGHPPTRMTRSDQLYTHFPDLYAFLFKVYPATFIAYDHFSFIFMHIFHSE